MADKNKRDDQPIQQAPAGFQQAQAQPQGQVVAMQPLAPIPGCPPGLEYLTQLDQLIIMQQVELVEALTGIETNNRYVITNSMGQQVFYALEDTSCLMRICCGPLRGFVINITDNLGQPVMRVVREFKCCAGCCWCATRGCDGCALELQVEAPPGNILGYVRQGCYFWKPKWYVKDANKDDVFECHGPCCICECPNMDIDFPVVSSHQKDQEVGRVVKQWSGCVRECFTKADTFSVTFPADMDVKMKANFLGLLFMVDFMYFENNNNNS